MKRKIFSAVLCLALFLTGCTGPVEPTDTTGSHNNPEISETTGQSETLEAVEDLFSNRDYKTEYDAEEAVSIILKGSTAAGGDGVQIQGSTVTITQKGTYIVSGTLDDGMIIVDTDKNDKVQLVLDNASIHSETCAPIYVRQSDKVFITLAKNSVNSLSNGGSFEAMDGNDIDAVIFSKDDLTFNGEGTLSISSPAGHGIVSKDELTVTSGTYQITTASHGIQANDNVCIDGGSITIASGKDGIQAENDEDETLGFIYVASGDFDITAEGDAISASAYVRLDGGSYKLLCGGGSENGQKKTSDNWGGFGGGMGGPGGRPGGRSSTASSTGTDSTSIKGIKAQTDILINGGSFRIDTADDAIHGSGNVTVAAGEFVIESGDDAFHADQTLSVAGGNVVITESYEGLEGLCISVSGGEIAIVSTDDGLNAAGGNDQSGFGGFRGGDRFGGGGSSDSFVNISGGTLYINASGDGIDANGTLSISGGHTTVCGPTQGDTAVLDYDISAVITGGTFIGTGSSMMAQTFSSSENQGVIALSVGNQKSGTKISVKDQSGVEIISAAPQENFAIAIFSCPEMQIGQTYTVTIGDQSGDFEAS